MNNKELFERFSAIAQNNPFDAVVELKHFRKEYKQSEFFKATKMPLCKAYKMFTETLGLKLYFTVSKLLNVSALSDKVSEFLMGIDEEAFEHLIEVVMNKFNLNNISDETGEIKDLVEALKTLNK